MHARLRERLTVSRPRTHGAGVAELGIGSPSLRLRDDPAPPLGPNYYIKANTDSVVADNRNIEYIMSS